MTTRFVVRSPGINEGCKAATCRIDYYDHTGKLHEDVYPCIVGNLAYLVDWFDVINDELNSGEPLICAGHHPFDVYVEVIQRRQDDLIAVDNLHGKDRYYKTREEPNACV